MPYTPLWGSSHSVFAAVSLSKRSIRSFITDDMDFSQTNLTTSDQHPVIFMLNRQKIRIILPIFAINYFEFIPLVPFVHFKDNPTKNYQTSPILYVSNYLIVLGAKIFWHLNKTLGRFKLQKGLRSFPKTKYLKVQVCYQKTEAVKLLSQICGEPGTPDSFPNMKSLMPLLTTDALMIRYPSGSTPAKYWVSAYQFNPLYIQPCSTELDVEDVASFPEMERLVPDIRESVLGSFFCHFHWKLPWPKVFRG